MNRIITVDGVNPGEPMNIQRFDQVKEQLLRMRAELLREVSESYATCRELGQDGVADIGDMSANAYNRDVLFNLSETQRQQIRDIDAALERIDTGDYGTCMNCGETIDQRRLEVRPFSRYCIECKTDIEKFGA
jgi:DnaK suppressor protein